MADKLYLSKVQIGDKLYYIKDSEAQEILATLGTAAYEDVSVDGVKDGETGLVTGGQVASAIKDIAGAMRFVAVLPVVEGQTFAQAVAAYKAAHSEYTEKAGDVMIWGIKEFVYADGEWHELGSEGTYVLKSTQIAGIAINDGITVAQLKTALGLGTLAYKNSATGTVAGQTISGVKATGTSTGSIEVKLNQNDTSATLTKGDYTPEGNVSGTVTANGSVSLAASESEDAFQVSGTVSAPTITVTPATTSVQHIDSVGTQASFTEGAFSQGSLPEYTQGSKAAWSASVTNETLSFSFTPNGDDTFSKGTLPSKAADTFVPNQVATKSEAMTVVTGITSASATAPVFTGGKVAAEFSGDSADITATFAGTKATNALVTGVTYKQAAVNEAGTKFTGANLELAVGNIAVAAKEVTVE